VMPTLDLVAVAEVDDNGIVGLLLSLQRFSVGACGREDRVATLGVCVGGAGCLARGVHSGFSKENSFS